MRSASALSVLALLLAAFLSACGADGPAAEGPGGLDGADYTLDWTAEDQYALGGFEAVDWDAFGEVGGIGFDDAGQLYILDAQAAKVHVVGTDGTLVRSFGERGEGPGELNSPQSMAVFPDGSVAVYDFGKFGFVRYGPDGEWAEDVSSDPSDIPFYGDFAVAGESNLYANITGRIRMAMGPDSGGDDEEAESNPEDEGDPVVRLSLDDGLEGEVVFTGWEADPPEGPDSEFSGGSEGRNFEIVMPQLRAFEPSMQYAGLSDGGFAVVDSTTYRVEVYAADGTLKTEIERPIAPVAVTPSIESREQQRQRDELAEREAAGDESGGLRIRVLGGGGGGIDGMNDMMRERVENMAFYPEIPVVEALGADREGRIWIQRSSGNPGEDGPTDVVTADGAYLGTIPADGLRIPDAFGPDGLAAWIETDEFDAARIVVRRIAPAGGTS